jgi:hypothetical protein
MIRFMYYTSEMTGSMFDVAVLSRLVLRCVHCCEIYTTTSRCTCNWRGADAALFQNNTYYIHRESDREGQEYINSVRTSQM